MFRSLQLLVAAVVLTAVGFATCGSAVASEKTYYLTSYSNVRFYDAEGNTLDLSLDTEVRSNGVTIIGVKSTLNGVFVGYAQPVLAADQSIAFWDARGVRVRLISSQYVVRSSELGPWYTTRIEPNSATPPQPPVQTAR
ncbi:MAG: hypothetical protein RI947_1549 [Candidatus Parcubacteria bacterium]|jgi:hypothetical protein